MKISVKPAKIGIKIKTQKVYPELEDIEITPSGVEQNFKSKKYGYDNVKVKAVASDTLDVTPTEEKQQHIGLYGIVNVDKIPDEYTKTEGTLEITDNGEYDVKTYEKANVSIEKKEDLSAELTEQDNLITTQEVSIEDITEALKGKMIGEGSVITYNYVSNCRSTFSKVDFPEDIQELILNLMPSSSETYIDCQYGFNSGKKPKKITITSNKALPLFLSNTFATTQNTEEIDLTGCADENGVVNFQDTNATFRAMSNLKRIIGLLNFKGSSNAFISVSTLEEIRIYKNAIIQNLSFSASPNLSDASIQSIIDGLADLTGKTAQTLTLNAATKAKLTETQIASITNKNWTLA